SGRAGWPAHDGTEPPRGAPDPEGLQAPAPSAASDTSSRPTAAPPRSRHASRLPAPAHERPALRHQARMAAPQLTAGALTKQQLLRKKGVQMYGKPPFNDV